MKRALSVWLIICVLSLRLLLNMLHLNVFPSLVLERIVVKATFLKEVELANESVCLRSKIVEMERFQQANMVTGQELNAIYALASRIFFSPCNAPLGKKKEPNMADFNSNSQLPASPLLHIPSSLLA
ncbi:hypothetical protein CUMW_271200 [Citrus unshiu]|uniref:Uncharacterized protein n=1 Tax=Citrus unshiu TaxID=55188 RepID=A0A2H5QXI4_CITUN|nr:hypothetical protein CUMW_271200 [Citrus unshiu]